jgi:hypothetical protein
MSLIPSSAAVQEKLERMREEKAAARAVFLAAVEMAKVDWEAEFLLALEEFRDRGGFIAFHQAVVATFEAFNKQNQGGIRSKPTFKELLERYYQHNTQRSNLVKIEGSVDILSVFLADKIDIRPMLYYGHANIAFHGFEGPTMASERAALRHAMLKVIRNEVLAPIQEEMRLEEERDRAFNEEAERRASRRMRF